MNKLFKYLAAAAIIAAGGCSKEAPEEKAAEKEIPKTFTEAREKGMLDAKWHAELQKLRKETAKEVVKINTELAEAAKRLGDAKAAKADESVVDDLKKRVEELRVKAEEAEKRRRRAVMRELRRKMTEDFAEAEKAGKTSEKAK